MTVGDILEWVAAACLVTAAYMLASSVLSGGAVAGVMASLVAAAGCLGYFAQCHADTPMWRRGRQ